MPFDQVFDLAMKAVEFGFERENDIRRDEIAAAKASAAHMGLGMLRSHQRAAQLQTVVIEQQREIAELKFALALLIYLARNSGAVDMKGYHDEVARQVAAHPRPPSPTTDRSLVMCLTCGGKFPRGSTVITEQGVLCDQCHHVSSR